MLKLPGDGQPRAPAVQTPNAGTAFEALDEAVEQPAEFRSSREYWICCDCWVAQDIDTRNENTYMLMVSSKRSQCKINGNIAFNTSMNKEWKDLRVVLGKCTITITESEMGTIDGSLGDENLVAATWAAKQIKLREAQHPAKAGQAQPGAASSDGSTMTSKKVDRRIMDLTDEEFATISERDLKKMKRMVASLSKHMMADAFESVQNIFEQVIVQKTELSSVIAEYEKAADDVDPNDDPDETRQTLEDLENKMTLTAQRLSFKAIPV